MSQRRAKALRKKLREEAGTTLDILIGMPSPAWVAPEVVDNILGLVSYTQNHVPSVRLHFSYAKNNRTDRSRNEILYRAIKSNHPLDYILWLDADMLYPPDMVAKYLSVRFDIIGALYFKRGTPTSPIVYMKKKNLDPVREYWAIDPLALPKDSAFEVDGVGFGGMMVSMRVYRGLKEKLWHHYGENFHLPFPAPNQLSHDLQFCKEAQAAGFTVKVHTGVQPGHISDKVINFKSYMEERSKKKSVSVIIPATDMVQAERTAQIMKDRSGMECDLEIVEDKERVGPVALLNEVVRNKKADYYVYAAQDAFPGRLWLSLAVAQLEKEGKGLLAFNDGKWRGILAAFGLVSRQFLLSVYQDQSGNPLLFHPRYRQHYGDTELTLIAMERDMYTYLPDAVLVEVDYDKDGRPTNPADRALFRKRAEQGFDGQVKSERLLKMFG